MIYIAEAHSTKWKIGNAATAPPPHKDFDDRLDRAMKFAQDSKCPFPLYVDTWEDNYLLKTHAWPDRFYLIDKNWTILETSEYGTSGDMDATVLVDCTTLLDQLLLA